MKWSKNSKKNEEQKKIVNFSLLTFAINFIITKKKWINVSIHQDFKVKNHSMIMKKKNIVSYKVLNNIVEAKKK